MKNVDYYLTQDHRARGRTSIYSIVIGASVGAFAQWAGASFDSAAILCVAAVALVELIAAFGYVRPDVRTRRAAVEVFPARRELIRAGIASAAMLALSIFRIPRIEAFALQRRLNRVVATPTTAQAALDVNKILATAKETKIEIPATRVASAGKKFVGAAGESSTAWDAALQFVNYRTQLNAQSQPSLPLPVRRFEFMALGGYHIQVDFILDKNSSNAAADVWIAGHAGPETCARAEHVPWPQPAGIDAQFILIDWVDSKTKMSLSDLFYKNVIIRNADIEYLGGGFRFENVYFVNCTFTMPLPRGTSSPIKAQEAFAVAVLENTSVTLTT